MTSFHRSKHLCAALFFIFILLAGQQVHAKQELVLGEINPQKTHLGVFNSFKHHLLIVAFSQKNSQPFDCQANRYILYDFKSETISEILAGNLKISSDYTKIFQTRIHTIGSMPVEDPAEWKSTIRHLINSLGISPQTMEDGKMRSSDETSSCWQQPQLHTLKSNQITSYPYLVANLCRYAWCNELYWLDETNVQFWVQIKPKEFHLIKLNTLTGTHEFKNSASRFVKKEVIQANAPRDNLINEKNIKQGSFFLNSSTKNQIALNWKQQANKKIKVVLTRNGKNQKAAIKINQHIKSMLVQKQYTSLFQLLDFGFWLAPDDKELKLTRLKVYASMMQLERFFNSLSNDFDQEERFAVCQKLHIDQSLSNLWKHKTFSNQYKKLCF